MLGQDLSPVQISDFFAAERQIRQTIPASPLLNMAPLNQQLGFPVYLKAESLLPSGAYKMRGATNKIMTLAKEVGSSLEIITASSGNHGMACALSASRLHIPATIVVPEPTPDIKKNSIRAMGANLLEIGATYDEAFTATVALAEEKQMYYVHPTSDRYTVAGQGTISLELLQQLPDVDVIITAIGGGGLISGVAKAVKELKPSCQVIGVQAEGAASMYEALRQDKIITLPQVGTMADGIQVKTAGTLTFDMCRQYVDKVITVSESEIAAAILTILEKQKLITEGAGAVSVAAVMSGKLDLKGKTVCALLSGGNVDVTMLERIIKHGLTAEGRIASFSTVLPDQPNALATYLAALSHEGVNVLEVYHERSSMKVGVGSCRVRMVVETRNHEHIRQLYSYLAEQGYTIKE